MIVNVDESSFNDHVSIRDYGWGGRGKRVHSYCLFIRGERYTLEMAISVSGFVSYKIYEGAMDGEDFLAFLEDDLVIYACHFNSF
jgi:hypothetical protein